VFPPNSICGNPTGVAAPPIPYLAAGSALSGTTLTLNATNPNAPGSPNPNVGLAATYDFTVPTLQQNASWFTINTENGNNISNGTTFAKTTSLAIETAANFNGAGQHVGGIGSPTILCNGNGDCSTGSWIIQYASAQIPGDEGKGYLLISTLQQQPFLTTRTIGSIVTPTACNTTTTQSLGFGVQTFTVASTTGCHVNDWIVINQSPPASSPNMIATQITAVGAGTLTANIQAIFGSGVTITPATVLQMAPGDMDGMGQQRYMVNLSATSYTTGQANGAAASSTFTGTGTTWTNNMVGGNANNIGCIELSGDDYTGSPFGSGSSALHSWFQIKSVTDATHLVIRALDAGGSTSYKGPTHSASNYVIQPCLMILWRDTANSRIIAETTTTTWAAGNNIEVALWPDPDVKGYEYIMSGYSTGGTYRDFTYVANQGSRRFNTGWHLQGNMVNDPSTDSVAFNYGYMVDVPNGLGSTPCTGGAPQPCTANIGFEVAWGAISNQFSNNAAVNIDDVDVPGQINFGQAATGSHASLRKDSTNAGLRIDGNGGHGQLQWVDTQSPAGMWQMTSGAGNNFIGLRLQGSNFSTFPTCNSTWTGTLAKAQDSPSSQPGVVVSAGGGSNVAMLYCNASNWTVAAANNSAFDGVTIGGTTPGAGTFTTASTKRLVGTGSAPTAGTCAGFAATAGSTDLAGRITFTSATTCSINFATTFSAAPFCVVTPGSAASTTFITTSTTQLSVTFGTANTAFFYSCTGS
jgi:hypothetical protein